MASPTTIIVVRVSLFSWTIWCEVTQYATVDALVRPRQVVAGCDGRILGIVLKELALYIVDDTLR